MKVSSAKAAQKTVNDGVRATPFTRYPGRPTRAIYKKLLQEAREAACEVTSGYEWSGDYGHLAIVVGAVKYLAITTAAGTPLTYVVQVTTGAFNPAITQASSDYQIKKKSAEWDELRECYYTLCGVEEGLCANFRAAVDEQYYKQLKKPIVGYRGIKIKDFFDHLDTKWCKLDTNSISEMKAEYYQKWVGEEHVTDFGKRLDNEQTALLENDITISDTDKQQFYIEQMYASRQFTREVMIKWEDKPSADKTWPDAKSYFEGEVAKEETYRNNSNGTTADARYESAANITEQGDALRDYLENLNSADNSANMEYMQQMTATNESMMNLTSKFQEQLSAKDEQIALILK